ncbi:unnamed protein product [Peniophora sp. CBMAI 1063]|nr:unnamed protein product [Peniophora sp. CBMAI 1063]
MPDIFKDSEYWTTDMEAQVEGLMETAMGVAVVIGKSTLSREEIVHHVAAERLKQSSLSVQLEIQRKRELYYKEDLEKWDKKFKWEPAGTEDAEEFAVEVNALLKKVASYVARKCSGVCVWYTFGPENIHQATGTCGHIGGRRASLHSDEITQNTDSDLVAHISAQAELLIKVE